jgi:hypothetical protein
VPPWRPGLPQANCATCRGRVVAVTLDEVGDCAQCAFDARWSWRRQQLQIAGVTG